MPKICYKRKNFRQESVAKIGLANDIIDEYLDQGFVLTLRQLYYQFVARDLIPNTDSEYDKLGSLVNNARLAGLIDWHAITDRTRFLRSNSHWNEPSDIIESAAASFRMDRWENQDRRPEVWIEKDALIGIIGDVCDTLDVPHFSCRGYVSQSEVWRAGRRFEQYRNEGKEPIVFHLGDHDPSGLDMTRDIDDRLFMFLGGTEVEVKRLALNMDQVEEFKPPPNPAKVTDSRASGYIDRFGPESWELDALEPSYIVGLIQREIEEIRDGDRWMDIIRLEKERLNMLKEVTDRWPEVVEFLKG